MAILETDTRYKVCSPQQADLIINLARLHAVKVDFKPELKVKALDENEVVASLEGTSLNLNNFILHLNEENRKERMLNPRRSSFLARLASSYQPISS